jgi:UDP-glucuronate 4-epimerase
LNVLITGGAGFIGSHLATRLINEGCHVTVIDCLHPYYSVERKLQQLNTVKKTGKLVFYNHNLLDNNQTIHLFEKISPEVVIHLAALPGVAYSIENPLEYVDYDIKATINVLEAAGRAKAAHVIFASSSSVYGNQSKVPNAENMAFGKVVSPYAAAKYSAESFCHVYEELYGYQMSILRFFTVYGPWGRPDMAISKFINKLMKSEEITLFGKESSRDYTYIDDIVNGILLSMTKLKSSEVLNIGSGRPISLIQLIEELRRFFPHLVVKQEGHRLGDVDQTWADISKAKALLGYEPMISFQEGITKTVEWARKHEVDFT